MLGGPLDSAPKIMPDSLPSASALILGANKSGSRCSHLLIRESGIPKDHQGVLIRTAESIVPSLEGSKSLVSRISWFPNSILIVTISSEVSRTVPRYPANGGASLGLGRLFLFCRIRGEGGR